MRRRLTAVLLLLAPLPAAAEAIVWTPPPAGLTTTYDAYFMGMEVEVKQRVVEAAGDEVTVQNLPDAGDPHERYFRFLLSYESQGALYEFDAAAVAALWPLEAGKTASTRVNAMIQGAPLVFDWAGRVVAIEELSVPAGTFRAARVEHTLSAPGTLTLETTTWLDATQGVPVRTDTRILVAGSEPQEFRLELRALD